MGSGCSRSCKCHGLSRRELIKTTAAAATAAVAASTGKGEVGYFPPEAKVPPPKAWWDALLQRGMPIRYAGPSLAKVAFPLGGIGTGSIALHGTGRLVEWQIFNEINKASFVDDSFFALRVRTPDGKVHVRALQEGDLGDLPGMETAEFIGEYPIARLAFGDKELPVEISLEALNPMIPLNEKDSALPCAILLYRIKNRTSAPLTADLLGCLQNAVGHTGHAASKGTHLDSYGHNLNTTIREGATTGITMTARGAASPKATPPMTIVVDHELLWSDARRPLDGVRLIGVSQAVEGLTKNPGAGAEHRCWWLTGQDPASLSAENHRAIIADVKAGATLILSGAMHPWLRSIAESQRLNPAEKIDKVFADFEGDSYAPWTVQGNAFGTRPATGKIGWQQPVSGWTGKGFVNTFLPDDGPQGTLTSPEFVIELPCISFLIGGGNKPGICCMDLVINGKTVLSETGQDRELLVQKFWDVRRFVGKKARLRIVDKDSGPWGHILVDDIRFSNTPPGVWAKDHARDVAAILPITFGTCPSAKRRATLQLSSGQQAVDLIATGHIADMQPRQTAQAVASSDGRTLLIEHRVDKGRVIVLLGDLTRGRERTTPAVRNRLLRFAADRTGSQVSAPDGVPATVEGYGTLCLATPYKKVSVNPAWTHRGRFWADFVLRGLPETASATPEPTPPGHTVNGALCATVELPAGSETVVPFVIAWHFPNHFWGEANIGNRYATWFADAPAVARYVVENLDRLLGDTRLYRDTLYSGTLPHYLIDAFGSQASIIRSQTCFWCADGTFAAFEGCGGNSGCCPMNCNHVWNYEQALAKLYPGIERDMRVTELDHSQWDHGGCAHRVRIPRPAAPDGDMPVADGQCGAVLKAYREYLQSPDETFTRQRWQRIRKAMEYAIRTWDPNEDGVMEKPQFNTYDRDIYGHNTFVTSLYLGALRAAEELAKAFADTAAAQRFRAILDKGRAQCSSDLYNGEYYIQKADNINLGYGTGVWADQVVGQWWAHQLDLGYILPADQVRSALKAIFKHNWLWTQEGFEGTQRFLQFADGDDKALLCGSWPKGGRPADPILYRDEAWTGVEYQVAAHKIWEGQIEEGLAIVKGARERYNGIKRNPWNEIECGDHYARAMSSWSLLLAAQGYSYSGPRQSLGFAPRLSPENHQSFFTTAEGWGSFSQKRTDRQQTHTIRLAYGKLPLKQLSFSLPTGVVPSQIQAHIDGTQEKAETRVAGDQIVLTFADLALQRGQTLTVQTGW